MESVLPLIAGIGLLLSLMVTALLSRTEVAFSLTSRSILEKLADEGGKSAARMLKVYRPRERLRLMILIGKSLAAVAAAICSVMLAFDLAALYGVPGPYALGVSGIVSVLLLILFDSIPPHVGLDELGENATPGLNLFSYSFCLILGPLGDGLHALLTVFSDEEDARAAKEEELRNIVESEIEEGIIQEEEKEMIQGIFDFQDTTVREVMVPRIDMVCAEQSIALVDLLHLVKEKGHSRIPIYQETVDNIQGIVYVKDLLHVVGESETWDIDGVMRKPYYVPENKKISDLLREFKSEKIHMAVVVDEYGGVAGIVTMEDVLEEIVGEIQDEYDEEEQLSRWESDGVLIADARIDIHDLSEMLDIEIPADGYDTLGGFIYDRLGRIPMVNETFEFEGLLMSIERVEGQRISSVRIVRESRNASSAKSERG